MQTTLIYAADSRAPRLIPNARAQVTVAIGETDEIQRAAAMRLMGMGKQEIVNQVEEIVIGQLRQVVASLSIEQINQDRESFVIAVTEHCGLELNKIGMDLINMNVQNIKDDAGVIDALGKRAAAEAVQQARIDVADRQRHGEIGVTMADKEKEIAVEEAEKERSIGVSEQQKEKDIRVAQAERDRDVGMREAQQESEVRRADLLAIETGGINEAAARVAASRAQLMVAEAESYKLGETSKALASASVQEAQALALAQAAVAEATKIEAEKRAELEAPAKAAQAELIVHAEARAAEMRIIAEGEAAAIYAKLDAEARGQYQILSQKAAGLEAIVAGVGGSQSAFQLLMLEHVDKLAETSAQAISNIKFDKVTVWDTGGGTGGGGGGGGGEGSSTANFIRGLATSMPPTLDMLKDVTGVDLPSMMKQQQLEGTPPLTTTETADENCDGAAKTVKRESE